MARSVAVLGTERRSERVHVGKSHCVRFRVQLPRNGKRSFFPEEILLIIGRLAALCQLFEGQRGYLKHRARAFAVAPRDQRGMHVNEPAGMEKFVNGKRRFAADAEHRAERVRSRAEISDLAEIFERMSLLLQGIFGRRSTFHLDFFGFDLERLFRLGR